MKQIISPKHLSTLIFILSIAVIIKLLWLVVSMLLLPSTGEEFQQESKAKKLYYRVRLTNESKVITSIQPKQTTKSAVSSMRGYKLLGIYSSKEIIVATVGKGSKTEVLSKGEKFNGFELLSAGMNFVIFKKNSEEFKLTLENITNSKNSSSSNKLPSKGLQVKSQSKNKIEEVDGVKRISKTLLTSYLKDMDKIWNDIALAPYKKNGKANGFKVNFVKKGSDMEKLGLKRGDILQAINAEPLNISSAMNFVNEINNLENLTLTVERNGKSEDLEYEIQ